MKELRQVSVLGLGLLGASLAQAVLRSLPTIKVVGYSHRAETRQKARNQAIASEICDDLISAVSNADVVVLASPICTFQDIFAQIAPALKKGCIVTDVGSTKLLVHRWAKKLLPKTVYYVGSHPIAGSEQRGLEFARDDLFAGAKCVVTATKDTNPKSVKTIKSFWASLGSSIVQMDPALHDKVLANVSHLPHITAAALVNASSDDDIKMAGKGFIDTSRVASGPANIWSDIFVTNGDNVCRGIDRITAELAKLRDAIKANDEKKIEKLLDAARTKRARLIDYKLKRKEIL